MATAAFSTRSLSSAPRPPPPTPSRTLTLALPVRQNPSPASRSQFQLRIGPKSFRASFKVAQSDRKEINQGEESHVEENTVGRKVDAKNLPSMKTLIQTYKKVLLDGDEKSACEIEAAILQLENEKNALSLKFTEMTEELTSGKEKFLRLKADFENFRKSSDKDRLRLTSDTRVEVVENLLPMIDSFERTKQQTKPDTEKEQSIETSYQGIYKQFVDIMRSLQMAVVETVGKPFDPSIHEAVAREESQLFKEGIVTQELRRGFFLGDRLLRPALVKVSSSLGPKKASPASENPTEQHEEPEPVEH